MPQFIDWILHVDKYLNELISYVGPTWLYIAMFAIIFCETGLVIMPFLPGDSLLFALGAMCAIDGSQLSLWVMAPLLIVAAILGDAVNYWLGAFFGPRIFSSEKIWWLNRKHLEKAQKFYDKYGAKTIVMARFVPIVRTFAPFVAGIAGMNFGKFWMYNVVGAVVWVLIFLTSGYLVGNIDVVKNNFSLVTIGIILVSVLPIAWEWLAHRRESKLAQEQAVKSELPINN